METDSLKAKLHLNYYVMFNADTPTEHYSPIVPLPFNKTLGEGAHVHGFDPELKGILPALWYCLHLPRNGLDTMDLSPKTIASGFSIPHSILLFPSYIDHETLQSGLVKRYPPTLIISEDSCYETAHKLGLDLHTPLGSIPISSLSSKMLKKHWAEIIQLMQTVLKKGNPLHLKPELVSQEARAALPLSFMANQLRFSRMVSANLRNSDFSQKAQLDLTIRMRSWINTLVEFEKPGISEPSEDEFTRTFDLQLKSTKVPMVITLPGTAGRLQPRGPASQQQDLSATERSVVDILGVHRAIARDGVWLNGGTLPSKLFTELHQLEDHCRGPRQANRFVWESMKRIGKHLSELLGLDTPAALLRASHITACTDFPIGLAILPGLDDPLCCIKPISYRPLTPLTRALQFELPRMGEHYFGKGFKVVIAECLASDDRIRPLSDLGWRHTANMLKTHERVQVVYSEVQSIKDLKQLMSANGDADILVISAHGSYEENRNFAGLHIGSDIWLAEEDDIHVPPVVILSACHVAPRGLGAVTVSDLLIRAGAIAVLGTLIPVDVRRNALLTARLFTYISEAVAGRGTFRSLDEAWHWVVASNAVNEILASSEKLMAWAHKRPPGKLSPIEVFMLTKSRGRLSLGRYYTDTIAVLREMAADDGVREYFDAVLASQGFFPESCFYVFTGSPENVILTEPIIE